MQLTVLWICLWDFKVFFSFLDKVLFKVWNKGWISYEKISSVIILDCIEIGGEQALAN